MDLVRRLQACCYGQLLEPPERQRVRIPRRDLLDVILKE